MKTTKLILLLTFLTYGYGYSQSTENNPTEKHRVLTSLTFQKNDAEQAMNFYVNLFGDAEIINIQRWGADSPGEEGTIMQAVFELNGHRFMVSDSPPVHNWDFTPAVSTYPPDQLHIS